MNLYTSNGNMTFYTNATEKMRITNDGNVGIGTLNPSGFQVNRPTSFDISTGSKNVRLGVHGNSPMIVFDDNWSISQWGIKNNGGTFSILTDPATSASPYEKLSILPSGNVGIGTTTPAELFQVGAATAIGTDVFYVHINNHGNLPAAGFGLKVGTNFSGGQGEVDFWNSWASALRSFTFHQRTASGNTILMYIAPDGDLWIAGDVATKVGGGTWAVSDARLKKDVQPLNNALEKISQIKGVTYEWKNPAVHVSGRRAGVIAQDLQKIFPDWVKYEEPEGADVDLIPKGEKALMASFPQDFNAYVIEAFKELRATVTEQKKRIESLEQEIRTLKAK